MRTPENGCGDRNERSRAAGFCELFPDRTRWTEAWCHVKENHGRAGADGVSIEQFEAQLDEKLTRLCKELEAMTYHPWPLLELKVEESIFAGAPGRPGGKGELLKRKQRFLRIPTVGDRVAQGAVLQIVGPWIEEQLEACSFGYRHGRGVQDAVEEVRKWHVRGFRHLVDADIDGFFDNVDHGRVLNKFRSAIEIPLRVALLKRLKDEPTIPGNSRKRPSPDHTRQRRIKDGGDDLEKTIRRIVSDLTGWTTMWVQAEVWDGKKITWLKRGLPQGSVISPFLANLFLDELDEALLAQDLKLVRYADDFVILCKTPQQAEQALRLTEQKLAQLHLGLNPSKTLIRKFDDSFKFLGVFFWKDLTMLPFEKRIRERRVLSLPPPLPRELAKQYRQGKG
jgi:retron-type reverse transcriptase